MLPRAGPSHQAGRHVSSVRRAKRSPELDNEQRSSTTSRIPSELHLCVEKALCWLTARHGGRNLPFLRQKNIKGRKLNDGVRGKKRVHQSSSFLLPTMRSAVQLLDRTNGPSTRTHNMTHNMFKTIYLFWGEGNIRFFSYCKIVDTLDFALQVPSWYIIIHLDLYKSTCVRRLSTGSFLSLSFPDRSMICICTLRRCREPAAAPEGSRSPSFGLNPGVNGVVVWVERRTLKCSTGSNPARLWLTCPLSCPLVTLRSHEMTPSSYAVKGFIQKTSSMMYGFHNLPNL